MGNLFDDMDEQNMDYLLNPDAHSDLEGRQNISIDKLIPFHDHPFRVDAEATDFQELVDSIRDNGLIYPIIVRPSSSDDDKYEILSGHRRYSACKELGMDEVPIIVRRLDDFTATTIMVHSNFYRETVLISEKAKAYRMCIDAAEKHSGKKGDDVAAMIGGDQDSKRSVYRYVRLSYLNDDLLSMVDEKKMSMAAGVSLSYLDEESQHNLQLYIMDEDKYPTMEMAAFIQNEYETKHKEYEVPISYEDFVVMFQEKENTPEKKTLSKSISLKRDELAEYFEDDADTDHIREVIMTLLQRYHNGEFGEI